MIHGQKNIKLSGGMFWCLMAPCSHQWSAKNLLQKVTYWGNVDTHTHTHTPTDITGAQHKHTEVLVVQETSTEVELC